MKRIGLQKMEFPEIQVDSEPKMLSCAFSQNQRLKYIRSPFLPTIERLGFAEMTPYYILPALLFTKM